MKNIFFILVLLLAGPVSAHGDDHKDHAHAAPSTVIETAATVPMLYAESEQFELVARLYENEFGIYIDRWVSNTPLLNAEIEVEVNGKKAMAKFHADHGDYAVTDAEVLKALHAQGEHAVMFTITAGKDADLLTGDLHVEEVDAIEALTKKTSGRLLIGAFAAVILIGCGLGVYHLLRARKEGEV